jgi:hypothetical protein
MVPRDLPIWRKLSVPHRMLDVLMAQIRLQRSRVWCPLLASANPQAWRSMCGWALKPSLASVPARSTIRAKPAVVKGAPRSLVNTIGDLGSCSGCSLRNARSSSPRIGWVLGDPFFTLCTARVAVSKSI